MRKFWLVLSPASSAAQAASFDCTKAKTLQEKAICASPQLSAADEQMAAAYKNALAATPAGMVAGVRDDQRAWVSGLATNCPVRMERTDEDMIACLLQSYVVHTKALKHLVLRRGGNTFVWRTIRLIIPDNPPREDSDRPPETNPGYGTLSASWPQTNNRTAEWNTWNKAIEAAARKIASQGKSKPNGKWLPEWATNNDIEVTVSIGIVGEQLITAFVDGWWGRGAHPGESSIQLNWLLREQRELHPDDVFRASSGWDQIIQERCYKTLIRELGNAIDSYHGPDMLPGILHEIILDPENWQLDSNGLTIIFQDYAVAPRAAHPSPVTISWVALQPYLQTRFVIPE